jgi:hypothetical protein
MVENKVIENQASADKNIENKKEGKKDKGKKKGKK